MDQPKSTRGGYRPGAGRKPNSPGGRRKTRAFIATDEEYEQIIRNSIAAGCKNPSEYIRLKTL
jgi:hypothetical protein